MGGAAGIWKKIKKIGSEVGSGLAKAFAWANTNLVQPLKPILTDFFYKAVLWAVENGITNGVDATHFGPAASCNRAQVVTFLYRAYN